MAKNNAVAGFNALNGVELNLFTTDELKAIHYATMGSSDEPWCSGL